MADIHSKRQGPQERRKSVIGGLIARRLAGKTRGQAMIYVALMMMTLLSFGALVADGGLLFLNRRQMQNAVDAAALAGVQQLAQDATEWDKPNNGARAVACDYATSKNGVPNMTVDCTTQLVAGDMLCSDAAYDYIDILVCRVKDTHLPNTAVRVIARKQFKPLFGAGLGWTTIEIKTRAIAMVGSLRTSCTFPIFQNEELLKASGAWSLDGEGNFVEYNVPTVLKTSAGGNVSGNFLALQVDGSSSKDLWADTVGSTSGCSGTTTNTVTTNTGNFIGPFDSGMDARALLWNNSTLAGYCPNKVPTFDTNGIAIHPTTGQPLSRENCYRVVMFPLINAATADMNGTSTFTIRGFLTFYIANWCGQNSNPAKGSGVDQQHCAAETGTGLPELQYGELWGYYLKYEAVTDLPVQPYDGLGTKVIVLVQ